MSTASINGHIVTRARVHVPAWGVPWVEASVDTDEPIGGRAVTFKLADLSMQMTVMSGGPGPKGAARYRLAGGAGSWGKLVAAKGYANDAGVAARTVLEDAARECGETIDPSTMPTTRLGPAYARENAPASRALEDIAPAGWYVDSDGLTRIGKRAPSSLPEGAQIAGIDRSLGIVDLASDSVAGIVPGVRVEELEAVDVMHTVEPGSVRSTLWTAGIASTSRELAALRRIMEQLDPRRRYRGVFEYRVVTQESERLNLQPLRVSTGMPMLRRVYVRPGVSGARANVALGSRVVVSFLDADPSRPIVIGFEDAEGDGFLPMKLEIDAVTELDLGESAIMTRLAGGTPLQGVARIGDTVVVGGVSGLITTGSVKVRCG